MHYLMSVATLLLAVSAAVVDAFGVSSPPLHSPSSSTTLFAARFHNPTVAALDGDLITTSTIVMDELMHRNRYYHVRDVAMYDVMRPDERQTEDIHLVMGPSGSGKTLFAVMDLGRNVVSPPPWDSVFTKIVRVYHNTGAWEFRGVLVKQGRELVELIQQALLNRAQENALLGKGQENDNPFAAAAANRLAGQAVEKLDMQLSVIIDDTDSSLDDWLEEKKNVFDLYSELEEKVASSVRLVIVHGATAGNNLGDSVYKYRMRPWGSKSFLNSFRPSNDIQLDEEAVLDEIESIPALNALKTNARAARFLSQRVVKLFAFRRVRFSREPHFLVHLSPYLFAFVCQSYYEKAIERLGKELMTSRSRAVVAKLVFHLLDRASFENGPEQPVDALREIVRNDCGDDSKFSAEQRLALALVNDQVQVREDGELKYAVAGHNGGQSYNCSVSISPALAALCYDCIEQPVGELLIDKSLLDLSVPALDLARRAILQEDCRLGDVQKGIRWTVQVTVPVPPNDAEIKTMVPVFHEPSIWINNGGDNNYADVVTDYTLLLRVKKPCDLFGELNKIGVVTSDAVEAHVKCCVNDTKEKEKIRKSARLGAATTSLLYHTWEDPQLAGRLASAMKSQQADPEPDWKALEGVGSHLYPTQMLLPTKSLEATTLDDRRYQMLHAGICKEDESFVVKNTALSIHEPLERQFERPLSVVFITNAKEVSLNHHISQSHPDENGATVAMTTTTTIGHEHVDKSGMLLKEDDNCANLVNWLDKTLKAGVVVKFWFSA